MLQGVVLLVGLALNYGLPPHRAPAIGLLVKGFPHVEFSDAIPQPVAIALQRVKVISELPFAWPFLGLVAGLKATCRDSFAGDL